MQPDLSWIKCRSNAAYTHILQDSVRGLGNFLISASNAAEAASAQLVTSYNSNGFTLSVNGNVNANAESYVAWQWNAGGVTVTNTAGSITSQVRANPNAGVSVVTWTGIGANATVGHGLGVAPKMVFVKKRSGIQAWSVWHAGLAGTEYLVLDSTAAKATLATMWNSTIPASAVFSIGTDGNVNANAATYVAYCFAEIAGLSKMDKYAANGNADGPFVYCGFRPKYVMLRRVDSAESWIAEDTSRTPYNGYQAWLYPNLSNAEASGAAAKIDFLSNGFKLRNSADGGNMAGGTYIFMAFAENPFQHSNAR